MARLDSIEKLRNVEWGKTYLWDLHFTTDSPPAPFNDWFPAISVTEEAAKLETAEIDQAYLTTIPYPLRTSARKISIEFVDDINLTLFNWLKEWINETILNNRSHVATLEEACRLLQIAKLDAKREVVEESSYWVFPAADFSYEGTSDGDVPKYSMDFFVAGAVGEGLDSTPQDIGAEE